MPFATVPVFLESHLELLHAQANDHAHLQKSQILAHAVRGPKRERNERVGIVDEDHLGWGLHETFRDKPALRPKGCWVAEVSRIAMDCPGRDASLSSFRNKAEAYIISTISNNTFWIALLFSKNLAARSGRRRSQTATTDRWKQTHALIPNVEHHETRFGCQERITHITASRYGIRG